MSLFDKRWVDLPRGAEELDPSVLAPGFRAGATQLRLKGRRRDRRRRAGLRCRRGGLVRAPDAERRGCRADPGLPREPRRRRRARHRRQLGERERCDGRAGAEGRARDAVGGRRRARPRRPRGRGGGDRRHRRTARDRTRHGWGAEGSGQPRPRPRHRLHPRDHDHRPVAEEPEREGRRSDDLRPGEGGRDDPARASPPCSASCRPTRRSPIPMPALRQAVDGSFERITVDGQMSTNDTVVLQATGETETPMPAGLLDSRPPGPRARDRRRRRGRRADRPRRR